MRLIKGNAVDPAAFWMVKLAATPAVIATLGGPADATAVEAGEHVRMVGMFRKNWPDHAEHLAANSDEARAMLADWDKYPHGERHYAEQFTFKPVDAFFPPAGRACAVDCLTFGNYRITIDGLDGSSMLKALRYSFEDVLQSHRNVSGR